MAVLWQLSVVEFHEHTLISGVVLHRNCPVIRASAPLWRVFLSTLKTYFRQPYGRQNIIIESGGQKLLTQTDKAGGFWLETDQPVSKALKVYLDGKEAPLPVCQSYPVYQPDSPFPLAVISDIDDTILVSYTANFLKRLRALFFVSPHKRQPVSFTGSLLAAVHRQQGRIFYVSKSESNLFGVLTAIIQHHALPPGHLFLTSYLRLGQLLKPKKGRNYKDQRIKKVLDNTPDKNFILLGDDTQRDMAIYTEIARQYPDRIKKIYIRRTFKNLSAKKKGHLNRLQELPVPVVYFADTDNVEKEIMTIENYAL